MTLDQMQQRDRRIGWLEARGDARTAAEQDELLSLISARDFLWRRLADQHARAIRRARELAAYAAQHKLPLDLEVA